MAKEGLSSCRRFLQFYDEVYKINSTQTGWGEVWPTGHPFAVSDTFYLKPPSSVSIPIKSCRLLLENTHFTAFRCRCFAKWYSSNFLFYLRKHDGRAGTFACAFVLLNHLRQSSLQIDVFGTVLALSKYRPELLRNKVSSLLDVCHITNV